MLSPIKELLRSKKIILASQSPRRYELLKFNCGIEHFATIPSNFAEDIDKTTCPDPELYVQRTATAKLQDILDRKVDLNLNPDIVISADTIVEVDGRILEKPTNEAEAIQMLSSLSGRGHRG